MSYKSWLKKLLTTQFHFFLILSFILLINALEGKVKQDPLIRNWDPYFNLRWLKWAKSLPEENLEPLLLPPPEQEQIVSLAPSQEEIDRLLVEFPSAELTEKKEGLNLGVAVQTTLLKQPLIKISELNIDLQKGLLQTSSGPFDPLINTLDTYTIIEDVQLLPIKTERGAHSAEMSANISKLTRGGTSFNLQLDLDQIHNPLLVPSRQKTEVLSFSVVQPLLRNFRESLLTQTEIANAFELQAVYLDTLQSVSQLLTNTAIDYWNLVANYKILEIQNDAVERLIKLTRDTESLAKEDEIAPTDVLQPLSQLTNQRVQKILAEQVFYSSLESLKFSMGITEEDPCAEEIKFLGDDFPAIEFDIQKFEMMSCCILETAYKYRYDLLAASTRQDEFEALLVGALNNSLPQLDLVSSVTKRDFQVKRHAKPLKYEFNHPETDWMVGVQFSYPIGNNAALGLVRQRRAEVQQAIFNTQSVMQNVLNEVRTALSDQVKSFLALKQAEEAVKEQRLLVEIERKKLEGGFSTIFFVVQFEIQLTQALITYVNTQRDFFQNIANLRFLTSTLLRWDGCFENLEINDLLTLPCYGEIK
jgi:outer membrane protein TolC